MHIEDTDPAGDAAGSDEADSNERFESFTGLAVDLDSTERALSRFTVDEERLAELQAAGFQGPAYDTFEAELWDYGLPVLLFKLRNGSIFRWCLEANVVLKPSPDQRRVLHSSREERDHLAVHTLLDAIPRFREKVLVKGTWRPDGGARLRTFFLNYARYSFQEVFREWQKARKQDQVALFQTSQLVEGSVEWFMYLPTFDPEKRAIDIDTIDFITRGQRAETKMICAYILLGLSYAEIGEQIGITTRAVEYRMRALRKHVNKLVERGVVEPPRWARERQQQPADAKEVG